MRAVDGLNSRPGPLQADQQSQDSDVQCEGMEGQAGDVGVRTPSVSGSAPDSSGGLGCVMSSSSKGVVNTFGSRPGSDKFDR